MNQRAELIVEGIVAAIIVLAVILTNNYRQEIRDKCIKSCYPNPINKYSHGHCTCNKYVERY